MKKITQFYLVSLVFSVTLFTCFSGKSEAVLSPDAELLDGRWTELVRKYENPHLWVENASGDVASADAALKMPLQSAPRLEVLARWWEVLSDDTLTQLVGWSLKSNRDLQSARAVVLESRAALGVSRAANLPWLDNADFWTRAKTSENGTGTGQTANLHHLGIDASWEIDLFGQNRENVKAAAATLEANYASLHGAWVSLSSEVTLTYLSLRTLQERLRIARENLELRTDTLELLQSQYAAGLTNALAMNQAQYSVEQTRASIPMLRTSVEETLNALAVLVGKLPGSLEILLGEQKPLPKPDAVELIGIPAEALRQRPDIRAAERRLAAQIARRRSAEKDLLPKFSLLGSIGLESFSSGNLFDGDSFGFSFGPRLTLPLFHGGAIRKNIQVQTAREEQLLAAYEQTVLSSVGEVRNALTANVQERERNASLLRGVEAARNAYEAAEDLYRHGLTDFNNVILTQQALL
ncbi:MAG: efflux transporter outer membrane subunit, partial [Synergistaceae bacterium]|nr:efflux transporter outer membrane subunit [Synergistaceae bacterium]